MLWYIFVVLWFRVNQTKRKILRKVKNVKASFIPSIYISTRKIITIREMLLTAGLSFSYFNLFALPVY